MPYGTKVAYKGYTLKSKHELAWAQFFDQQGIPWEYEPIRFKQPYIPNGLGYTYTPDFAIEHRAHFIEIKTWNAVVNNNIHFCLHPLMVIFGMPSDCYIRVKPANERWLSPGHIRSWDLAYAEMCS